MARHEITMSIPSHDVVNKDVTITVKSNDVRLGKIKVSKGSIDWWPKRNTTNFYTMSWERFQEVMEANGRQVRK